jgi:predicted DNA-binding transcriptional regulator YafY
MMISYKHGDWFIRAFCKNRNNYRDFKLIRIRNIRTGESFIKRDDSKEQIQKIFDEGYGNNSIKVTLKFTNKMNEALKEYFVKERINAAKDGSYIVSEMFPHEEGLIKYILSFGADCEVLEPVYLREEIKEYISKMQIKYNS